MARRTISKAAAEAGVHVETIRYYERRGLIQRPSAAAGYRAYPDETVRRIRFVKRAQALGFTLTECAELLAVRAGRGDVPTALRARVERKAAEIEERIAELRARRAMLRDLAERCPGSGDAVSCSILNTLEGNET